MEIMNDAILQRAKFLAQHFERSDLHSITLLILYDLGISVHCSGFDYLKHIVPLAFQKASQIYVKELMEEVGKRYSPNVEYSVMETAVRDAIKKARRRGSDDRWKCYFPDYILQKRKPPTNAEFISALAYFLEMWYECCKEGSYEK